MFLSNLVQTAGAVGGVAASLIRVPTEVIILSFSESIRFSISILGYG